MRIPILAVPAVCLCLVLVLLLPGLSHAQGTATKYPNRPITYILPVPPGGGPDLSSRVILKEVEKILGQPFIIVNKPGGSFAIGIGAITVAKPDGYTIGYAGHPGMFFAPFMDKVPYHPVKDLKQIVQFGLMNVSVVVKGDSPFKKFEDVIAYARLNPRKLTYGSAGVGTAGHVFMEQVAKKEGVQLTHIPFKGGIEAQTALLGGHILVSTGDINHALFEAGQIRLLLLISERRSTEYPDTPILKEFGYDFPTPWFLNVAGPKGMPDEIVKRLEDAFTLATKEPAFIKGMKDLRLMVVYRNSQELGDYVATNYEIFGRLLKGMGFAKH